MSAVCHACILCRIYDMHVNKAKESKRSDGKLIEKLACWPIWLAGRPTVTSNRFHSIPGWAVAWAVYPDAIQPDSIVGLYTRCQVPQVNAIDAHDAIQATRNWITHMFVVAA